MSRFLYRNLELLEPYEGKLSCTVLRGESSRKGADLPDKYMIWRFRYSYTKITDRVGFENQSLSAFQTRFQVIF